MVAKNFFGVNYLHRSGLSNPKFNKIRINKTIQKK